MQAAALVADPARDPHVEVEIEIAVERIAVTGKAVDHGRPQTPTERFQDLDEAAVGIALVHEDRKAEPGRDLEVRLERPFLVRAGREVPVEVETGLADRDHLVASRERFDRGRRRAVKGRRLVRVHARGGPEPARVATGERRGRLAVRPAGPGHHDTVHPGAGRPGEHVIKIGREGLVAEVRPDVDELHGMRRISLRPVPAPPRFTASAGARGPDARLRHPAPRGARQAGAE